MISYLAVIRQHHMGKVLRVRQPRYSSHLVAGESSREQDHRRVRQRGHRKINRTALDLFRLCLPPFMSRTIRFEGQQHVATWESTCSLRLRFMGRGMLAEGFSDSSTEFYEVCRGLSRALGLRPWQPDVFDFELYVMEPSSFPPHADFRVVEELHRRLVAAA